jgi:WD40 repeat protein
MCLVLEVRISQSCKYVSGVSVVGRQLAIYPHACMSIRARQCLGPLIGLNPWSDSCLCSWHRHLLVTGSCDATCRSWDLRTGRQLGKYQHPDHFEEVRHVAFHGDTLLTGCYDGLVRQYDLPSARLQVR